MTSQTKKYIELSDLLVLKMTCKGCGSALEIPMSRSLSGREDDLKLKACPVCLAPWALRDDANYHPAISGFTAAVKTLANAVTVGNLGFSLTIEITDEKPKEPKP
jgi:hypothetical protein